MRFVTVLRVFRRYEGFTAVESAAIQEAIDRYDKARTGVTAPLWF